MTAIAEGDDTAGLKALIVGCGYTGQEIARLLLEEGWQVTGTTYHADHLKALRELGVNPVLLELGHFLSDEDQQESFKKQIDGVRLMVFSAGPHRVSGERFADHALSFSRWLKGKVTLSAFVYLSSTGVYGDVGGDWVDENTPLTAATGPRGRLRREVEAGLLLAHSQWGLPVRIVRAAGIYGPGRHVGLRLLDENYRVIEADPPFVVNRIHVTDLARTVVAAALKGKDGEVYLAADGQPAPVREVVDYAASLMGKPAPPGESAEVAEARMGAANFRLVADRKRCKNNKIIDELGVELAFPDYREGYWQVLTADGLIPREE